MVREPFRLEHPCGVRIHPELREAEVSALAGETRHDMRTGYVWYSLPVARVVGQRVACRLCFHHGALSRFSVAVCDDELYGRGWSEWSQDKEERRARDTGSWFTAIGFPIGEYSWGTVYAGYDPRSATGGGGVTLLVRASV